MCIIDKVKGDAKKGLFFARKSLAARGYYGKKFVTLEYENDEILHGLRCGAR